MVTNTIVINLGTRRAPTVNKDMGSMVPAGMDKDITSWAGTYVLFEMVDRMERSEAPCVDGAGTKTCRWCRLSDVEWTIHFVRGWCTISLANLVLLLVFFFFFFL